MSNRTKTLLLTVAALIVTTVFSQVGIPVGAGTTHAPRALPTPEKTLFSEYRGVKIGMPTADVRTKLGKAKDESDTTDQYIFSDSESVQFYYDASKNVNAIMITFMGDVTKAPTAKDIFGADVAPNDQGMIFKMERYPKAGYWISYTRTAGADAMVNIALQKM
jgi:hypothetical protein